MKIYKYKDYEDYVEKQTLYNKQKINWTYVTKRTITAVANNKQEADSILCHGTRNGAEQKHFKECFPDAYIIGTEISDTASQFPMTIQHDFTLPREEWIGKFDIIYSNSFDHTIDPLKTLLTWKEQLSSNGKLYLEYSESQSVCEAADPLMATNEEIKKLVSEAGLKIIDTFQGKKKKDVVFICVRKNT